MTEQVDQYQKKTKPLERHRKKTTYYFYIWNGGDMIVIK